MTMDPSLVQSSFAATTVRTVVGGTTVVGDTTGAALTEARTA
ncbi:hypothetical protein [Kitasatospora sp. NPDC097643]